MTTPTPTPVASFGKDPKIAESVRLALLPDIEVVHISLTLPSALSELPALCGGDLSVTPSSGLGTHACTESAPTDGTSSPTRRVPQAVFFGGDFSADEYSQITAAVGARNPAVRFFKVQKLDVLAAGSFGPNPETIAKIYRKKMAAAGVVGVGDAAGGSE